MEYKQSPLPANKAIALVAHDNKKQDLLAWCRKHLDALRHHQLMATGTTGALIERETGLAIHKLISGPLGGDQQVGALITEGKVDMLVFFWDPFEPMPHDPDVKALLRIAAVWNIPVACNQVSADFMVASPCFSTPVERLIPDYAAYMARRAQGN
ncbi:methylglyoxal synthase [Cellvibrio japonicus]|uniref:Methylglyoxal synthase n=1 Tax=Cellvibrio japonicus (strain Ueda107) TaxID=498211 RepID=MGSA_CELJU|nr:methylglyoxal synthase [Cellvibrio japonicus]B3PFP8.1 RecName: Full=Methylglyoxal synthase; Short=MGS [Cellvibrio japonicus Ueda107]ACE85796.1 methylglyoxal synthase [Cellvibrio japonicus Ueda107]QEI12273.1 methylglyoxal synthase [Cellvibrio japonicus]QEI15847.1 methylglyoxal synthase [Cellvibrio japonicus]QEI19425.1 methylglyoxal synthase [Cellvibrio japonicus]